MEENIKKELLIIGGAFIIFVIAVFLCLFAIDSSINNKDINRNYSSETNKDNSEINKILENIVVLDEESKTDSISDVGYKDITIYKEDGSEVKLSEFKDKPVMILFWNKENDDSIKVLEKVEETYKSYEDTITFLMISTEKELDKEIKNDISMELYYDSNGEAAKSYNVDTVPSMIYINKNNEVVNAKKGFTTSDALEANLDILADNI